MQAKLFIYLLIASLMPLAATAQHATHKHKAHKTVKAKPKTIIEPKVPTWAEAQHYDAKSYAYFPDYYTYYDPQRGGYMYWKNGAYTFSPSVPPFLESKDLGKSRVQILKGLSLDLHPEREYPRYMKLYPAVEGNDGKVPVPIMGNPDK